MKLLFIESYPHVVYGQQRTMLRLLNSIKGAGHECVVACTSEGAYVDLLKEHEYKVELIPYPEQLSSYGGAIYRYKRLNKLKCYAQGIGYLGDLRRKLKDLRPDAIYCNDMRGLLTVGVAAKVLGIPVMIWDKLDKPHGWLDWLQLPLVKSNLIITSAVAVKYPKWQRSLFSSRIERVPEGLDLEIIDRAQSVRSSLLESSDSLNVGIVGSISERKGHDRIFAVLPQLLDEVPNLHIFVVGDEAEGNSETFKSSLPMQHEHVHFLGVREDVASLMKSFDLLVVPSRQEGMGMVILEAMGASIPVVGARTGGIPEVIEDGETGILFDGDSKEQLLEAIVRLASDSELQKKMGEAGRARVEKHFDRERQMSRVVNLLEGMR